MTKTGCRRASAWSCRSSAAKVRSFLRRGLRSNGGQRSPPESDSISATSETVARLRPVAEQRLQLVQFHRRRVGSREPRSALQLADKGVERALLIVR